MTAPLLGLETTLSVTGDAQVVGAIGRVGSAAKETTDDLFSLDSMLGRLTERFAAYEVLHESVRLLRDFADEGLEAARASQLLDFQLKATGDDFAMLSLNASAAIEGVSRLGLSTETELTTALQRLTLVTGDAQWAISHLTVAQDIAAATGMDLVTASTDLGRAYNGVWMQLERLGLVTKEQVESGGAMDALIAKTKGATEAATEGAGAWFKLGTEIKNTFEEMGRGSMERAAPAANLFAQMLQWANTHSLMVQSPESARLGDLNPLSSGFWSLGLSIGSVIPSRPGAATDVLGGSYTGAPLAGPMMPRAPGLPGARVPGDTLGLQQMALQLQRAQLQSQLAGTSDLAKRVELTQKILEINQKLQELLEAHAPIPGWGATNLGSRLTGGGMTPDTGIAALFTQQQSTLTGLGGQGALGPGGAQFQNYTASMQNQLQSLKDKLQPVAETVGQAVSSGISAGLASGHDRVLNVLRAMGEEILGVIGGLLVKRGETLLAAGLAEAGTSLFAGNAARDIAGGTAMIAIGSALNAVGGGAGGSGGGGGGGGSASSISPSGVASRQFMTPNATQGYAAGTQWPGRGIASPHITVIGPGDASAQYGMQKLMQNMVRRGMTVSGIGGS